MEFMTLGTALRVYTCVDGCYVPDLHAIEKAWAEKPDAFLKERGDEKTPVKTPSHAKAFFALPVCEALMKKHFESKYKSLEQLELNERAQDANRKRYRTERESWL